MIRAALAGYARRACDAYVEACEPAVVAAAADALSGRRSWPAAALRAWARLALPAARVGLGFAALALAEALDP